MSFLKLIRNYIQQNETTSTLSKLAGPAVIGLSLSMPLVGCGDADSSESIESEISKADKAGGLSEYQSCEKNKDCQPGYHCKKINFCDLPGVYCVFAPGAKPEPKNSYCVANEECDFQNGCDANQLCLGLDSSKNLKIVPVFTPYPGPLAVLPPEPNNGQCYNTCDTQDDCAKGEDCIQEEITVGTCPEGALCIFAPKPVTQGVCKPQQIMPIIAPPCTTNQDCIEKGLGSICIDQQCAYAIMPVFECETEQDCIDQGKGNLCTEEKTCAYAVMPAKD